MQTPGQVGFTGASNTSFECVDMHAWLCNTKLVIRLLLDR